MSQHLGLQHIEIVLFRPEADTQKAVDERRTASVQLYTRLDLGLIRFRALSQINQQNIRSREAAKVEKTRQDQAAAADMLRYAVASYCLCVECD